jgi:type II secretory pathway pseudopilin PulG
MTGPGRRGAFSLIEVVIAVAIFSFAAVSILALLPLTARQAAGSRDLETAARLCDAVRLEAQRLVQRADFAGFSELELVVARDGTALRPLDPTETAGEQYFLIEIAPYGRAPLQFSASTPLLVLAARVTWPFRPPGGGPAPATSPANREEFGFVFALRP